MKKLLALVLCLLLVSAPACAEGTVLTVLSGNEPSWEYEFQQNHPEITIQHREQNVYGQAYQTLLMTENGCDIYELSIGPLYESLKEKGYLLPLPGSQALDDYAAQLDPYMQQILMKDGTLYAVPMPTEIAEEEAAYWGMWGFYASLWEERDLGKVPETYSELLSTMIAWETDGEPRDYRLLVADFCLDGLPSAILRAYVRQYEREGEVLSFDTPIFREVMTLLKEYQAVCPPQDDRPALLTTYGGFLFESCAEDEAYVWMAPLAFEAGQAAPIPVNATVYAVSASTAHPEAALAYVEAALQSQNDVTRLMTTCAEPCELRFDSDIVISKEKAESVRALAAQVQYDAHSLFLSGTLYYDMEGIVQQYLRGTLPLDMMILQLNQRAVMASMEME